MAAEVGPESSPRALAFAAMSHAALLVHTAAQGHAVAQGQCVYLLRACMDRKTPPVAQLFPPGFERDRMLRSTINLLQGGAEAIRVLGYNVELIELARRLRNHPEVVARLSELLDEFNDSSQDPAQDDDPNEAELAQIYRQTISTLGRRIQVVGSPEALQQPATANRIRALLLAGVRCAWLWTQLGGRRWQLVFGRRALVSQLQRLESRHGE